MIKVLVDPPTAKKGEDLLREEIDPEIQRFSNWFKDAKRGNGDLTRLEREILRVYLYQKATGVL